MNGVFSVWKWVFLRSVVWCFTISALLLLIGTGLLGIFFDFYIWQFISSETYTNNFSSFLKHEAQYNNNIFELFLLIIILNFSTATFFAYKYLSKNTIHPRLRTYLYALSIPVINVLLSLALIGAFVFSILWCCSYFQMI